MTTASLPPIGTRGYTALVLAAIRSAGWTIDSTLFSVLLLVLIVGKGGMIVDVAVKRVEKALGVIAAMTRTIFQLSTLHLHLDAHTQPDDLDHLLSSSPLDVLLISGLEHTSSPARIKLNDILLKRQVGKGEFDPMVIWVREQGAEAPSWLIDHFICGVVLDDLDVAGQAGCVIPPSYISSLRSLLAYTHIHPPLQIHISNLLSAASLHPSLKVTMTQRSTRAFCEVVRAHRLLSGGFDLPEGWEERLNTTQEGRGLGGGRGGVDTWASLAGEEPSIADIGGGEDWYATPNNVSGVWGVCLRHRAKRRNEREEVMWLMKGSAGTRPGRRGGVEGILDEILRTV